MSAVAKEKLADALSTRKVAAQARAKALWKLVREKVKEGVFKKEKTVSVTEAVLPRFKLGDVPALPGGTASKIMRLYLQDVPKRMMPATLMAVSMTKESLGVMSCAFWYCLISEFYPNAVLPQYLEGIYKNMSYHFTILFAGKLIEMELGTSMEYAHVVSSAVILAFTLSFPGLSDALPPQVDSLNQLHSTIAANIRLWICGIGVGTTPALERERVSMVRSVVSKKRWQKAQPTRKEQRLHQYQVFIAGESHLSALSKAQQQVEADEAAERGADGKDQKALPSRGQAAIEAIRLAAQSGSQHVRSYDEARADLDEMFDNPTGKRNDEEVCTKNEKKVEKEVMVSLPMGAEWSYVGSGGRLSCNAVSPLVRVFTRALNDTNQKAKAMQLQRPQSAGMSRTNSRLSGAVESPLASRPNSRASNVNPPSLASTFGGASAVSGSSEGASNKNRFGMGVDKAEHAGWSDDGTRGNLSMSPSVVGGSSGTLAADTSEQHLGTLMEKRLQQFYDDLVGNSTTSAGGTGGGGSTQRKRLPFCKHGHETDLLTVGRDTERLCKEKEVTELLCIECSLPAHTGKKTLFYCLLCDATTCRACLNKIDQKTAELKKNAADVAATSHAELRNPASVFGARAAAVVYVPGRNAKKLFKAGVSTLKKGMAAARLFARLSLGKGKKGALEVAFRESIHLASSSSKQDEKKDDKELDLGIEYLEELLMMAQAEEEAEEAAAKAGKGLPGQGGLGMHDGRCNLDSTQTDAWTSVPIEHEPRPNHPATPRRNGGEAERKRPTSSSAFRGMNTEEALRKKSKNETGTATLGSVLGLGGKPRPASAMCGKSNGIPRPNSAASKQQSNISGASTYSRNTSAIVGSYVINRIDGATESGTRAPSKSHWVGANCGGCSAEQNSNATAIAFDPHDAIPHPSSMFTSRPQTPQVAQDHGVDNKGRPHSAFSEITTDSAGAGSSSSASGFGAHLSGHRKKINMKWSTSATATGGVVRQPKKEAKKIVARVDKIIAEATQEARERNVILRAMVDEAARASLTLMQNLRVELIRKKREEKEELLASIDHVITAMEGTTPKRMATLDEIECIDHALTTIDATYDDLPAHVRKFVRRFCAGKRARLADLLTEFHATTRQKREQWPECITKYTTGPRALRTSLITKSSAAVELERLKQAREATTAEVDSDGDNTNCKTRRRSTLDHRRSTKFADTIDISRPSLIYEYAFQELLENPESDKIKALSLTQIKEYAEEYETKKQEWMKANALSGKSNSPDHVFGVRRRQCGGNSPTEKEPVTHEASMASSFMDSRSPTSKFELSRRLSSSLFSSASLDRPSRMTEDATDILQDLAGQMEMIHSPSSGNSPVPDNLQSLVIHDNRLSPRGGVSPKHRVAPTPKEFTMAPTPKKHSFMRHPQPLNNKVVKVKSGTLVSDSNKQATFSESLRSDLTSPVSKSEQRTSTLLDDAPLPMSPSLSKSRAASVAVDLEMSLFDDPTTEADATDKERRRHEHHMKKVLGLDREPVSGDLYAVGGSVFWKGNNQAIGSSAEEFRTKALVKARERRTQDMNYKPRGLPLMGQHVEKPNA